MINIIEELRRRNVFRVVAVYAVVAWLLIEVVSTVLPTFEAPDWVVQTITLLLILGFPIVAGLAWAFDITPEGIVADAGSGAAPASQVYPGNQTLLYITLGFVMLFGSLQLLDSYGGPDEPDLSNRLTPIPEQTGLLEPALTPVRRSSLNLGSLQRQQSSGLSTEIALSPDGTRLAYTTYERVDGDEEPRHYLYVHELAELEPRLLVRLRNTFGVSTPVFSPDNEWIAVHDSSQLLKYSIFGGQPEVLVENLRFASGIHWNENGDLLYSNLTDNGIYRISEGGGTPEALTQVSDSRETHGWPQLLPGGKILLFTRSPGQAAIDGSIDILDLETGQQRDLVPLGYNARYIESGHIIFMRQSDLWAQPFDLQSLSTTGVARRVIADVESWYYSGQANYTVSNDGLLVYRTGSNSFAGRNSKELVWVDRNQNETPLDIIIEPYWWPRLTRDGNALAVTISDEAGSDIFTLDLQRSILSRVTSGNTAAFPMWSTDERRIIFKSIAQDQGLWSIPADGTGQAVPLDTVSKMSQLPETIAADGSIIFRSGLNIPESDLYVLSPGEIAEPRPLIATEHMEFAARLSPDGRWLAYTSDETSTASSPLSFQIFVRPYPNIDDGKWQVSTQPGSGLDPQWSQSGDKLYYRSDSRLVEVDVDTSSGFHVSEPRVVVIGDYVDPSTVGTPSYAVADDGERVLMMKAISEEDVFDEILDVSLVLVNNWFAELNAQLPARN